MGNENETTEDFEARADACLGEGRRQEAIALYARAILASPERLRAKEQFMKLAGRAVVDAFDPLIGGAILGCLRSARLVDCQQMQKLWLSHVTAHPDFRRAFGLHHLRHFDPANQTFLRGLRDFRPLMTDCFLEGIKHIVPTVPLFEEFMTHLRRHLLLHPDLFEDRLTLATALAQYAFNTGYILDTTDEEADDLRNLGTDDEDLAVLACYRPLLDCGVPSTVLGGRTSLRELYLTQVEAPDRLARTRVLALTEVDDRSSPVRAMYEAFPYPAWTSLSVGEVARQWQQSRRSQEIEGHLGGRRIRILIAGCGTGVEALSYAAIFPQAEVLAIDLSRNSLAYAMGKAQELGIENVQFRQADILKLDGCGERVEYIVSSGVLHHLADPFQGWRTLRGLLAPEGLMKIALYSGLASRHVLKAQAVARALGYDDLKQFRKDGPALLDPETLHHLVSLGDYYNLSMYKDLLFHVQDHHFSIPQLAGMLEKLELEFAGFHVSPAVTEAYLKQHPDDPRQTDWQHWHDFEIGHPDTFRSMYMLWCRPAPERSPMGKPSSQG